MPRTLKVRLFAALAGVLCICLAYTQTPPPRPATAQKIKDDLYMIQGEGGNVAMYITDEGVILVDDMYERNYNAVMTQVKMLSDKPVKYVINTHHHDDHAGGNIPLLNQAEIIAHKNVRANMIALKQGGQPRVTFSDEMDVVLGGKEVRAMHYSRGHTSGDSIIYFPADRVIHTGDLFLTRPTQPYMDFAAGGSALEWTKSIDEALKLDFDTIIPGHGPISNREGLIKWRADFVTMRDRISGMVKGGRSKQEISDTLTKDFGWPVGGLAIGQVDAFIAELKR